MLSPKRAKYLTNEDTSNKNTEHIIADFQKALEEIESYQQQMEGMQDKAYQDILKVEQKLEIERKPIYVKRDTAICRIPNFWVTALFNHPEISAILHESEEEYLMNLTKIDVQAYDDILAGFKITFHFRENPFFENSFITKEYFNIVEDGSTSCQITSTPVLWKEGCDISSKLKERKTFFHWLTSHEFGATDIEVAQVIKDDLWINPLQYYLLSDVENDHENSDDDDENDFLIIEDSEDDESNQEDIEEEDSDNDNEEYESHSSLEINHNENDN